MHDYAMLYINYDMITINVMKGLRKAMLCKKCYEKILSEMNSKSMRGSQKNVILCLPERK